MPSFRFLALAALLVVACCTGYALLVLSPADPAAIAQLDRITQHLDWHIRPVSTAQLQVVRGLLWAGLGLAATAFGLLSRTTSGQWELQQWRQELAASSQGLRASWQQLPRYQRVAATMALVFLLALRVYFSLTRPPHAEEVASYEFFVRQGLLAVSAYYPIPNNHILSNTLSWVFYQVVPSFWWTMRLPVLLVSTAGTVLWFTGLLRTTNFRVALLTMALFSCLQLALYHASAGRGYWLLITLAGTVFFATLRLSHPTGPKRLASLPFLLAGVLGMYTVPSFAYVLASAGAWLGFQYLHRGAGIEMIRLGVLSTAVVLGATALYAPLLLVSGIGVLVGNGFVAPRPAAEFWAGLPAYLWFNEGSLVGQRSIGAGLWLLVVIAAAVLIARRLLQEKLRPLAELALWWVLLPNALLVLQRVFPPERVLLYKALPFFLLVALLADYGLRWAKTHGRTAAAQTFLASTCLVFIGYQIYTTDKLSHGARPQVAAYQAAFSWLSQQPSAPILAPEPLHNLYFRFFAHTQTGLPPASSFLVPDAAARPGVRYRYVVAFPEHHGFFQPEFNFKPAYRSDQVEIHVLPDSSTWTAPIAVRQKP